VQSGRAGPGPDVYKKTQSVRVQFFTHHPDSLVTTAVAREHATADPWTVAAVVAAPRCAVAAVPRSGVVAAVLWSVAAAPRSRGQATGGPVQASGGVPGAPRRQHTQGRRASAVT
jgi:hypothetical protein